MNMTSVQGVGMPGGQMQQMPFQQPQQVMQQPQQQQPVQMQPQMQQQQQPQQYQPPQPQPVPQQMQPQPAYQQQPPQMQQVPQVQPQQPQMQMQQQPAYQQSPPPQPHPQPQQVFPVQQPQQQQQMPPQQQQGSPQHMQQMPQMQLPQPSQPQPQQQQQPQQQWMLGSSHGSISPTPDMGTSPTMPHQGQYPMGQNSPVSPPGGLPLQMPQQQQQPQQLPPQQQQLPHFQGGYPMGYPQNAPVPQPQPQHQQPQPQHQQPQPQPVDQQQQQGMITQISITGAAQPQQFGMMGHGATSPPPSPHSLPGGQMMMQQQPQQQQHQHQHHHHHHHHQQPQQQQPQGMPVPRPHPASGAFLSVSSPTGVLVAPGGHPLVANTPMKGVRIASPPHTTASPLSASPGCPPSLGGSLSLGGSGKITLPPLDDTDDEDEEIDGYTHADGTGVVEGEEEDDGDYPNDESQELPGDVIRAAAMQLRLKPAIINTYVPNNGQRVGMQNGGGGYAAPLVPQAQAQVQVQVQAPAAAGAPAPTSESPTDSSASPTKKKSRRTGRRRRLDTGRFKTVICRNFMKSGCVFGDQCAFAHGDNELSAPVEDENNASSNGSDGRQNADEPPAAAVPKRPAPEAAAKRPTGGVDPRRASAPAALVTSAAQ